VSRSKLPLAAALIVTVASVVACRDETAPTKPAAPAAAEDPAAKDVAVSPQEPGVGTFVALAKAGGRRTAFVADEEDAAVLAVDLDKQSVIARASLRGAPGQLLLGKDGTIYAAVRGAAEIVALRLVRDGAFREVARQRAGHEPYGLALADRKILATSIGDAALESYATTDLAPGPTASVSRDPRSVIVAADGKKAFVSHATGSVMSAIDLEDKLVVRAVKLDLGERRRDFGMVRVSKPAPPSVFPDGVFPEGKQRLSKIPRPEVRISMTRSASQGFALTSIRGEVLLPESLVLTGDKERIPAGYGSTEASTLGSNVPYVARIGERDEKPKDDQFSGPSDRVCFEKNHECMLPRAVATDGKVAFVACLDTDQVQVIDPTKDVEHHPTCEDELILRPRIEIERPSGVAFDRERNEVVAFSVFTRKLSLAAPVNGPAHDEIRLPRVGETPSEQILAGRALFHESRDPRISSDHRACASCHVDGREDGMVWPTPKGTRQTPMLAGRLDGTGPFGWNGEHATLPIHITETVGNLGGKGLPKESLEALAAFVVSMKVPARRGSANATVARGKEIFESSSAECASCHVEKTRFTDREAHALAQGKEARFDTPSLHFVGLTPPYFHDGRFKTLEELVDKCDGTMGSTKQLTANDRQALVEFLRTL